MEKECINIHEKETVLIVQDSQVRAIRKKNIEKKALRVYSDNNIGVAGGMGDISEEELLEAAIRNLDVNIKYPFPLERKKEHRVLNKEIIDKKEFIEKIEKILETLRNEYEGFQFSNNVAIKEKLYSMKNTNGLDLSYSDSFIELVLIIKEKGSPNIFDGFLHYLGRKLDIEEFLSFNRQYLKAHNNRLQLPKKKRAPVFLIGQERIAKLFSRELNGKLYYSNSSIFSGKKDQEIFNTKINIFHTQNPIETFQPFFDSEGCTLIDDKEILISKGRLMKLLADKKTSHLYKIPHTGGAGGDYDEKPQIQDVNLKFEIDSHNIKALIKGEEAILVVIAEGGDFSSNGNYASPVQSAFLFDGERIIGRIPEFSMRSNIYKMLGEDYIGTFDCPFYFGDQNQSLQLQGYYMEIDG